MTKEQFMNEKLLLFSAEQVAKRDAAWAQLVRAEMDGKLDTADEARQALRDLGVDVDALLGDG